MNVNEVHCVSCIQRTAVFKLKCSLLVEWFLGSLKSKKYGLIETHMVYVVQITTVHHLHLFIYIYDHTYY